MNSKISVVIRSKNQAEKLAFLLRNLRTNFSAAIDEIVVVDNNSVDNSNQIASQYNARFLTIANFSYGGSANFAAQNVKNDLVVIFSAHSFPINFDFFTQIKQRFDANPNLAGIRCLHSKNDFKNYINKVAAPQDINGSGLIFSGSAFNKKVWEKYPFKADIVTFEDKEWSTRVIKNGYEIEFSPSFFCYDIKRSPKELFFRFKNETVGGYQLWHTETTFFQIIKNFIFEFCASFLTLFTSVFYTFKRLFFMLGFFMNKPSKF